MNELTCICVSVYAQALTRGRQYTILDQKGKQYLLEGDNGRVRLFPNYCFTEGVISVPVLAHFQIEHPLELAETTILEVTVTLSTGEKRWCLVATPAALAHGGNWIEGTTIPFRYGLRHLIIASELNEVLIGRMLHYIDSQGQLLECTLPLTDESLTGNKED